MCCRKSKLVKMRLRPGLCPDSAEELTTVPKPPSWTKGVGWEGKGREETREEGEKEGRGDEIWEKR